MPTMQDQSAPVAARRKLLPWLPLGIGGVQVFPCAVLLMTSAYRVSIGATSLLSASFAQPFEWFHQDLIRLPLFAIAIAGSLINLYLLWNARRLRNRPAAAWRKVPLTDRERRTEWFQLLSSLATLLIIGGDFVSHWWFLSHHLA
jgi:hypothetical protein